MVLQVSSTKKLRQWQIRYVLLLWRFREFVELNIKATKAKDYGMARHWWDKRTRIWNIIQKYEQRAPEEIRVEELMRTVLKMIARGRYPKQILEELYGKE